MPDACTKVQGIGMLESLALGKVYCCRQPAGVQTQHLFPPLLPLFSSSSHIITTTFLFPFPLFFHRNFLPTKQLLSIFPPFPSFIFSPHFCPTFARLGCKPYITMDIACYFLSILTPLFLLSIGSTNSYSL